MLEGSQLDTAWVLLCAGLVFLMQGGFMCLESGLTRAKNSINVAVKNLADIGISVVIFWAFGFALMFGASTAGLTGTSGFFLSVGEGDAWQAAFFVFQAMFCGTAITIVSGAVAERMRFGGYLVIAFLLSIVIYPLYGHWAWNGIAFGARDGWLAQLGFTDFAGATVVHSVAGWVALAAVMIIGPREGRFPSTGPPNKIPGHNLPIAMLGAVLLWLGWFGFNGGAAFSVNDQVPRLLANTLFGGAAGMVATLAVGWFVRGRPDVDLIINGALAGLVAITAGCHVVHSAAAILIGAVGGITMLVATNLLERYRIDDPVGAIPVHAAAGVWGTAAVALFGDPALLATGLDRGSQLLVQLLGIAVAFAWAFAVPYFLLRFCNRYFPLRVTPEDEHIGLNVAEHGASTELIDLLTSLEVQAKTGDLSQRMPVEPFTEVGQIAARYNQVMDALQHAMARTEVIVRDIRDGIVTFTPDGSITSFNPGAEQIFGHPATDMLGQPATLMFDGQATQGAESIAALIGQFDLDNPLESSSIELQGRRRDGSVFPLELTVTKGEIDKEIVYTALVRDISERKAAEKTAHDYLQQLERERENLRDAQLRLQSHVTELQEAKRVSMELLQDNEAMRRKAEAAARALQDSEARVRLLMDSAAEGIFGLDQKGHCTFCNAAAVRLLGYESPDDLLGKNLHELIHHTRPDGSPYPIEESHLFRPSSEPRTTFHVDDEVLWRRDGTSFPVEYWAHPMLSDDKVVGHVLSFVDITESKQAEAELLRAKDEAEAATRAKSIFLANMSHELRTPLNTIIGFTRLVAKRCDDVLPDIQRENLKKILISAEHLLTLINAILDLSKVEAGHMEVHRSSVEIPALIEVAVRTVEPMIENKQLRLIKNFDSGLPALDTDADKLKQILINLLSNAVKFTNDGDISVTTQRNGDDTITISVTDTGVGIPPNALEFIFEEFRQLDDGRTRSYGGTGLGLSITRRLVRLLDGEITVKSTEGVGSTFTVTIPVR